MWKAPLIEKEHFFIYLLLKREKSMHTFSLNFTKCLLVSCQAIFSWQQFFTTIANIMAIQVQPFSVLHEYGNHFLQKAMLRHHVKDSNHHQSLDQNLCYVNFVCSVCCTSFFMFIIYMLLHRFHSVPWNPHSSHGYMAQVSP